MDILTPKYWEDFIRENGNFDGKRFENLVQKLLPTLGLDLIETQISWDGARDFENRDKRIWAECKMYKERVSIRTLSPTLVMAIIDNPNKIYFFSYSPLNNNAVKYLSQFQENMSLLIYIIDDKVLEKLILNCSQVLEEFFNFKMQGDYIINEDYELKLSFSKDPEIEYTEDDIEDPKNKLLIVQSIFVIDIFLRNLNFSKTLRGELDLELNKLCDGFLLLNKDFRTNGNKLEFEIAPSSIFFKRLYFKTLRSGTYMLPEFSLNIQGAQKIYRLNENHVRVLSIIKTNLIGKSYQILLKKFKEIIQGRHQPVFINLYGESGTGKSRMLQEFIECLFEENFIVLKFDGEGTDVQNFRKFIRICFSRLYKLPLVTGRNFNNHIVQDEFIYQLLYQNDFDYNSNITQILDNFVKAITSKKAALVIDNLQNFDELTVIFLQKLIHQSEQTTSQFAIVCCFNTSILYSGTKNFELWDSLCLKGITNDKVYLSTELKGFDKNAFITFLDNCIKNTGNLESIPFSDAYPETTELFSRKILNRPLFVEQTLLYLDQERAVERIYDSFVINDIRRFHDILNNSFPDNLFRLLARRWDSFLAHNNQDKDKYLKTINFLVFFNHISFLDVRKFGIDESIIVKLVNQGFVVVDQKESISFYHFQLFLFFKKEISFLQKNTLVAYKAFIEENNLIDKYYYQYFIILSKLDIAQSQLQYAVAKILYGLSYNDYLVEFINNFFQNLLRSNFLKSKLEISLLIFLKVAKIIQVYQSMEARHAMLATAFEELRYINNQCWSIGRNYLEFVHDYINSCITVHKDEEAIKIMSAILLETEQMDFISLKEKEISIGKLLNRSCVLYKALRLDNEAIQAGIKSLEIAKKYSDLSLEIKNYVDIANVYGRSKENLGRTLTLWESAIAIYRANQELLIDQRAMIELYEGQYYLLTKRESTGLKVLKDGFKYCEAHSIHFFQVKYLLIQIVWELTTNKHCNFEQLLSVLYKTKDLAIRYQITRTYWKILYLEAKVIELINPNAISGIIELYIQVINQFVYVIKSAGIEKYNNSLFNAMAYLVSNNRDNPLVEQFVLLVKKLYCFELKNSILNILKMSESELELFCSNQTPKLIYNDGKFDLPIIG